MNIRDLFGALEVSSTVPPTSTPCVERETAPVATREVIFASAARPPMAASTFSTASSAVCAWATPAQRTIPAAVAHLIADFITVLPVSRKPARTVDQPRGRRLPRMAL